jgi:hypothetical protein
MANKKLSQLPETLALISDDIFVTVINTDTVPETKKIKFENVEISLDHGSIGGLSDDDHNQYYNSTRHTLLLHTGLGLVPDTIEIISGSGLSGGGNLSSNRTLAIGAGTGIVVGNDDVGVDLNATFLWTGSHEFNIGVTMNSWLTVGTQLTLNNLVEDVDVELKLKRDIGGDFSIFWNGDIAWTTKIFRPFDLIINRISDTEPDVMWAGMVWIDP